MYFQESLLLWIKSPVFTLHSSILIKIPPCTLIWFLSKFQETRVYFHLLLSSISKKNIDFKKNLVNAPIFWLLIVSAVIRKTFEGCPKRKKRKSFEIPWWEISLWARECQKVHFKPVILFPYGERESRARSGTRSRAILSPLNEKGWFDWFAVWSFDGIGA